MRLPLKEQLVLQEQSLVDDIVELRRRRLIREGSVVRVVEAFGQQHRLLLAGRVESLIDGPELASTT
jgi:hypothetical protein